MAAAFDPYHKWLGILPKDQPPHHYRLLAIEPFEDDVQVIEAAADRQLSFLRKFQSGEHAVHCQKLLNEVSRVRLCLLKPSTKAAYDAQLREQLEPDDPLRNIDIAKFAYLEPLSRQKKGQSPSPKSTGSVLPSQHFFIPALIGSTLLFLVVLSIGFLRGCGAKSPVQVVPKQEAPARVAPTPPRIKPQAPETPSPTVTPKAVADTDPNRINLLPLLKPEHGVVGEWKIDPDRLVTVGYTVARQIRLPVAAPREYTIHLRGTRLATPDATTTVLGLILVYGKSRSMFVMDVYAESGTSGMHLIDERTWKQNEAYVPGFQTVIGRPFDLDAIVRDTGIEIRVDGGTIVDWQGEESRLSLYSDWTQSASEQLVLAAESQYVITELTLGPPLPRRVP